MTPLQCTMLSHRGLKMSTLEILQSAQCSLGGTETTSIRLPPLTGWRTRESPLEGMTGRIKIQKWWSGTNCADVTFPKVHCRLPL